jgi:hypothetical protein
LVDSWTTERQADTRDTVATETPASLATSFTATLEFESIVTPPDAQKN